VKNLLIKYKCFIEFKYLINVALFGIVMKCIVDIDESIQKRLKDKCIELGVSQDELINEYINRCLDEDESLGAIKSELDSIFVDNVDNIFGDVDMPSIKFVPEKDPLTDDEMRKIIAELADGPESNIKFSDAFRILELAEKRAILTKK